MSVRLPHFLIIGAQKCGTTWLHHRLSDHPDIYLPEDKDHEFFSLQQTPSKQQIKTWAERYTDADQQATIGDATASYFWTQLSDPRYTQLDGFNPNIPKTVADTLGTETKIIIILRDPVERAISAYLHHISMGSLHPGWPIFSAPANLGLLAIGFFGQHLKQWLAYFPAESIYVEMRSIKQDHQQILSDICTFLKTPAHLFAHSAQVVYPGMPRQINEQGIWMRLQDVKNITDIQRALPITTINSEPYIRVIHPTEIEQLKPLFAADQQLLNQLLEQHKAVR